MFIEILNDIGLYWGHRHRKNRNILKDLNNIFVIHWLEVPLNIDQSEGVLILTHQSKQVVLCLQVLQSV